MNPVILYISLLFLMLYSGFGLFIFLGFYMVPTKQKIQEGFHFFSVIIPFRNEENNLPLLIESIKNLNYPNDAYEIIFVNDHSEDNGEYVITSAGIKHVQCIRSTGKGKKQAIITGIGMAKGEWVAFTDADCQLPPDWLQRLNTLCDGDMILGPVMLRPVKNMLGFFQEMEWAALQSISASTAHWKIPVMSNGANLAYKKSNFDSASLKMDTPSGDDIFMMEAIKRKKRRVQFSWSPSSVVSTRPVTKLYDLIQQRIRWASKNKFNKNIFNLAIAILTTIINLIVLFNLIYFPFSNSGIPWMIVGVKSMIDILIILPYLILVKRSQLILLTPLFTVTYPLYFIYILMLSLKGKFIWKGRSYHA